MAATAPFPSEAAILTERARLMQAKAGSSAFMVFAIIMNAALLMVMSGQSRAAVFWVLITCTMIGLTRLYAKYRFSGRIEASNATGYIHGHMIITAMTGLVWSGFAIATIDLQSDFSILIASIFLVSISLGGFLPGSPHRGDYLIMASCALLPFATYVLAMGEAPVRYLSIGFYIFYCVCWLTSRTVDAQTRSAIVARLGEEKRARLSAEAEAEKLYYTDRAYQMASIGHDMAQPVLAQRHHLDLLRQSALTGDQEALIRKLEATQSSQETMIRNLMDYQRAANAAIEPVLEVHDLSAAMLELVEEWMQPAKQRSLALISDLAQVSATTDIELVKRIVRNLLSNAIKFTPQGGTVRLGLERDRDRVLITVRDNGPGIADADQGRVFDPYVRVAAASDGQGLGLGLATAQTLAGLLEARLSLDSEPQKGCTFRLSLPDGPARSPTHPDRAQTDWTSRCLLILSDDDDHSFGSWTNLLTGWRMAGLCAGSLDEAIQLMDTSNLLPDILVLDLARASDDECVEAVARIRERAGRGLPVIVVEGKRPDSGIDWDQIGDAVVMSGPLHAGDLRKAVAGLL
ncbi:hybrid sensor histidine kinase/response regulator [Hoeflea sp.]|uniref:hybrid sensor histidine kinase/response regulator n=1 Tax=Hoeflea sp. TaxID=1940281 RepID=UPI003BAF9224